MNKHIISKKYHRYHKRGIVISIILLIVIAILMLISLCFGDTSYTLQTLGAVLLGENVQGASFAILTLRMPRMLIGLFVGFALGVAGTTFQRLLHNPLASPDIIGVSVGSSAAAVFCILILQMSGAIVSIISIVFGLFIAAIIYLCAQKNSFSGSRMILIGLGMQAMMNAVISYVLLKANQQDVATAFRWLSGSLTGMQMNQVAMLAMVVISCTIVLCYLERYLKVMELGEEISITLGVKTNLIRGIHILCAVILVAFSTSICGPIAFVAFLAGPIAKQFVGAEYSRTMIAGMVGAILVISGDFIGQYAFSTRFPVGVICGVLGAPYLLLLLIRMNKSGGAT